MSGRRPINSILDTFFACRRHVALATRESRAQDIALTRRDSLSGAIRKNLDRRAIAAPEAAQGA